VDVVHEGWLQSGLYKIPEYSPDIFLALKKIQVKTLELEGLKTESIRVNVLADEKIKSVPSSFLKSNS